MLPVLLVLLVLLVLIVLVVLCDEQILLTSLVESQTKLLYFLLSIFY